MNRILATLSFFTRLPFWRLSDIPKEAYERVVPLWPLAGWLTSLIMYAVMYAAFNFLGYGDGLLCYVLALLARIIVTGALHEDGLADFCDGFGGGTTRERTLEIMKDSHIGTYGVIALIAYFALLFTALLSLPSDIAPLAILAADPFARMVTSQLILMMPYARTADTAKSRTVYRRPSVTAGILLAIQGLLPLAGFLWLTHGRLEWTTLIFVPCLVMYFLYRLIWGRLRGYTGDCCGAVCLLVELSFYLSLIVNYGE